MEQRLCRWLLMTRDRAQTDKLKMTHEFISHMLGVRREGVTNAAHHLENAGFIRYVRGHIEILDRRILEAHVWNVTELSEPRTIACSGEREGIFSHAEVAAQPSI
jgi:Mn-dependent DtxR family transcriptional regulator